MEDKNEDNLNKAIFVHNKIITFSDNQQKSLDFLNNKVNWIIVADVALIGFLTSGEKQLTCLQLSSFLFIVISLLIAVSSVWSRKYSQGPKLKELIEKSTKWSYQELVDHYNKKLEEDITKNESLVSTLSTLLKSSIVFLGIGILYLFLATLINNCLYMDIDQNQKHVFMDEADIERSLGDDLDGFSRDSQKLEFTDGEDNGFSKESQEIEKGVGKNSAGSGIE